MDKPTLRFSGNILCQHFAQSETEMKVLGKCQRKQKPWLGDQQKTLLKWDHLHSQITI